MDELVELVREELESRTNHEVVFFWTNYYHSYDPMFQVGALFFLVMTKAGCILKTVSTPLSYTLTVSGCALSVALPSAGNTWRALQLVSMSDYAVNTRRKRHITGLSVQRYCFVALQLR